MCSPLQRTSPVHLAQSERDSRLSYQTNPVRLFTYSRSVSSLESVGTRHAPRTSVKHGFNKKAKNSTIGGDVDWIRAFVVVMRFIATNPDGDTDYGCGSIAGSDQHHVPGTRHDELGKTNDMPGLFHSSTPRECPTRNYLDLAPATLTMNRHQVGALCKTDCRAAQTGLRWVEQLASAGPQESFQTPRGVLLEQRETPRCRRRLRDFNRGLLHPTSRTQPELLCS
jgi:hypothetical protein